MDRRTFVSSLVALPAALKALSEPSTFVDRFGMPLRVMKVKQPTARQLSEALEQFEKRLGQFSLDHGQEIINAVSGGMR